MSEKPFDHYLSFETMDFVMDEEFQDWARHSTPEREAYWQAFLVAFPQKTSSVRAALQLVQSLGVKDEAPLSPEQLQHYYQNLISRLDTPFDRPNMTEGTGLRSTRRWWLRLAAGVIPCLLGWGTYRYGWAETEYQTYYGEQKRVLLADQTVVTLGANSQLRIPGRWAFSQQREVWLRGEGYFEVSPQPQSLAGQLRNFFVHTPELHVEVLGTRFNVNTNRGKTTVLLDEGTIQLATRETPKRWLVLQPGQIAEVPASRPRIHIKPVTDPNLTAWRDGRLVFRSASLSELQQRLKEVYGLGLVFEGTGWEGLEYTGELPTQDLSLSMRILAETFEAAPLLVNDQLVLRKPNS